MKRFDVAIAVVFRDEKVLICRRKSDSHLPGLWEFPGGKIEPGETPEQCIIREVAEEVDIQIKVTGDFPVIAHDYPDRAVRLHPFLCAYQSGELKPIGCQEAIWVDPQALRGFTFPDANSELIEALIQRAQADRAAQK